MVRYSLFLLTRVAFSTCIQWPAFNLDSLPHLHTSDHISLVTSSWPQMPKIVRIYSYQQNTTIKQPNTYFRHDKNLYKFLKRTNVRIRICIENCTNIRIYSVGDFAWALHKPKVDLAPVAPTERKLRRRDLSFISLLASRSKSWFLAGSHDTCCHVVASTAQMLLNITMESDEYLKLGLLSLSHIITNKKFQHI